jgi:hypothetical protein
VIPYLNKVYISNSPECLFQIKSEKKGHLLWSMPIKGSEKMDKSFTIPGVPMAVNVALCLIET